MDPPESKPGYLHQASINTHALSTPGMVIFQGGAIRSNSIGSDQARGGWAKVDPSHYKDKAGSQSNCKDVQYTELQAIQLISQN